MCEIHIQKTQKSYGDYFNAPMNETDLFIIMQSLLVTLKSKLLLLVIKVLQASIAMISKEQVLDRS